MAAELSFLHHTQNASISNKDYADLYKRAREATREAQREGDAQLKAAMAAATAVPINRVCICPLSLRLSNAGRMNSEKKDFFPIMFQFLLRAALLCLLLQTKGDQMAGDVKGHTGPMNSMHALKVSISYIWVTAFCATMMIMQSVRCSSWSQGNRGIIVLLASSLLCYGELVAISTSCKHPTLDLAYALTQCLFSSSLHRAPLGLHFKIRLFGYGLQTLGTLAMADQAHEAIPSVLYFSLSHFLGAAFAYFSDQQSCAGYLKSCSDMGKIAGDSQIRSQQAPKRALGGFAGGFAGVSGLKCSYPPSIWTVFSSSYGSSAMEGYVSEISCSSSSTVEDGDNSLSARHPQHLSCISSSNKDPVRAGDSPVCSARSPGLEYNVYWQFRAATRGSWDG